MVRFALLLLMAAALSPAHAAVDMDTAAQIYEAAAVREQVRANLGAMPKRIREMFVAEARTPLTDAQLKAITDSAERGFRIDVFEPAAIAALAEISMPPRPRRRSVFSPAMSACAWSRAIRPCPHSTNPPSTRS